MMPDVVCYTTLIHGYAKINNIKKCWELYEECSQKNKPGQDIDEQLMSYMIRMCCKTHDSEKAIKLFNDLELDGFVEHSKPYNSILAACASTRRYAGKAIEYWHLMHAKSIMPDQLTYTQVLKACAQLGDTQTAYDVLQEMKLNGMEANEHTYNQLIKVYAGAVALPNVLHEHIDMYIRDAWILFDQVEKKQNLEVNTHLLNSMVLLYANALRPEELEAKVFPLFDKFRHSYNVFTFQEVIKMFYNTRDLDKVY